MRYAQSSRQKLHQATVAVLLAALFAAPQIGRADRLTHLTEEAFAGYVRAREARMSAEEASRSGFLWIDTLPQPKRDQVDTDLKKGGVLIKQDLTSNSSAMVAVPGGLIQD